MVKRGQMTAPKYPHTNPLPLTLLSREGFHFIHFAAPLFAVGRGSVDL
jgi:hypothetical protein